MIETQRYCGTEFDCVATANTAAGTPDGTVSHNYDHDFRDDDFHDNDFHDKFYYDFAHDFCHLMIMFKMF